MFTFEPERWLRPKKSAAATEEDVEFNANVAPQDAFGLSMRGCWGRKLAYIELRMLVALGGLAFRFVACHAGAEQYSGELECYASL
jgi:hypothetical protein